MRKLSEDKIKSILRRYKIRLFGDGYQWATYRKSKYDGDELLIFDSLAAVVDAYSDILAKFKDLIYV
jgi:hypothetical protein